MVGLALRLMDDTILDSEENAKARAPAGRGGVIVFNDTTGCSSEWIADKLHKIVIILHVFVQRHNIVYLFCVLDIVFLLFSRCIGFSSPNSWKVGGEAGKAQIGRGPGRHLSKGARPAGSPEGAGGFAGRAGSPSKDISRQVGTAAGSRFFNGGRGAR